MVIYKQLIDMNTSKIESKTSCSFEFYRRWNNKRIKNIEDEIAQANRCIDENYGSVKIIRLHCLMKNGLQ